MKKKPKPKGYEIEELPGQGWQVLKGGEPLKKFTFLVQATAFVRKMNGQKPKL
jgi:hypothetical protein